jgi:hypothetical protein
MTDDKQTITTDHLRALLDAEDGGALLALLGGRIELIAADEVDTDAYRGALEVITRDDLTDRVGPDPTGETLAEQAAALTVAVHQLGG